MCRAEARRASPVPPARSGSNRAATCSAAGRTADRQRRRSAAHLSGVGSGNSGIRPPARRYRRTVTKVRKVGAGRKTGATARKVRTRRASQSRGSPGSAAKPARSVHRPRATRAEPRARPDAGTRSAMSAGSIRPGQAGTGLQGSPKQGGSEQSQSRQNLQQMP
jgi:hypothetical protein